MSKMNNWMMDIEDFCNGYFFDAPVPNDFTVDEVLRMLVCTSRATKHLSMPNSISPHKWVKCERY